MSTDTKNPKKLFTTGFWTSKHQHNRKCQKVRIYFCKVVTQPNEQKA